MPNKIINSESSYEMDLINNLTTYPPKVYAAFRLSCRSQAVENDQKCQQYHHSAKRLHKLKRTLVCLLRRHLPFLKILKGV